MQRGGQAGGGGGGGAPCREAVAVEEHGGVEETGVVVRVGVYVADRTRNSEISNLQIEGLVARAGNVPRPFRIMRAEHVEQSV